MFARSPYEIDRGATSCRRRCIAAAARRRVAQARPIGMSFWTDAAILGGAGIPSVLFGPTGAGLHGLEEWVDAQSVLTCRDCAGGSWFAMVLVSRGIARDARAGRSNAATCPRYA